ncbi:hypothetical protein AA313_de0201022 [Arthrobotrys entomopaga]|nr:hypothetical protein AA313_de0201022 [Arthrobotrys entomopaga]
MATTQDEEDTPMATSEQSPQLKDTSNPSKPQDRTTSKKKKRASKGSDSDDESDSDPTNINVDFEFFDPQEHDFHGIKQLLRQLFDADAHLLDLSALADLILEQKLVGSTVKVDGMEGDPYSFLTVINWDMHKENPAIKSLSTYLLDRAQNTPLQPLLTPLLSPTPTQNTAIVLSERLLNMPADISPPSYKMLLEEIQLAVEDNEPYNFTHYLLLSKVYTEIESKLPISDDTDDTPRPTKRNKLSSKKKKKKKPSNQTFNFHPEDDFFLSQVEKDEAAAVVYSYKHEPPEGAADAKRAFQDFGILPKVSTRVLEYLFI